MRSTFNILTTQAGGCLIALVLLLPAYSVSAASQVDNAESGVLKAPVVSYHNEMIGIKAHSVPLRLVLEEIATSCNLGIYTTTSIESTATVDVEIQDRKVEETLAFLLKDVNHFVVYNENRTKTGLHQLTVADTHAPSPLMEKETASRQEPENQHHLVDRTANAISALQKRIDMLKERIDSGASDTIYQDAIKRKDPSFVTHDRVWLERCEKQLAMLENRSVSENQ